MNSILESIDAVERAFPFDEYMHPWRRAYIDVAKTALKYLPQGGRILDFASGPCDKTAVLQKLGFECTAYDDLQDDWHKIEGNKAKILAFAREIGLNFVLANENTSLPFQKSSFDMIMMHGVLEHLHDSPCNLVNTLLEFTQPKGLLFVTVPNAVNIRKRVSVLLGRTNYPDFDQYYWHPAPWRGHVREYVKGDLHRLAVNLDLEILELRSAHHMLKVLPPAVVPAYEVITSLFPGWRDTWLLVARKKQDWSPKKALPPEQWARLVRRSNAYKY